MAEAAAADALTGAPAPATRTAALTAAVSRAKAAALGLAASARPWAELADRTAFAKPADLAEATTRIRKNAAYFRVNYAAAAAGAAALALVLHPGALAVLAALAAGWAYLFGVRTTPLTINGRTLSHREQLLAAGGLSVFVVFFLTGVGALLFSALGFAGAAVAAHASFRVPDELFTDEVDPSAGAAGGVGGLMGLLGGAGGLLGGGGSGARPVAAAV